MFSCSCRLGRGAHGGPPSNFFYFFGAESSIEEGPSLPLKDLIIFHSNSSTSPSKEEEEREEEHVKVKF